MPKLDLNAARKRTGSGYPAPFNEPCMQRIRQQLGDAGGLTQFGVNLLTLPPGSWSSQRHWHTAEDEFVYVLSGEVTLITNKGEEVMRPGDFAAFPKNDGDGHHLVNKSKAPATVLEVGARPDEDFVTYPDIDMIFDSNVDAYTHRDGSPYPKK
jgi:uncharacterized cupin superfamily protein